MNTKEKSPLGNDWLSREFDPVIAKEVGVDAAIMYRNIVFWCKINQSQGINFYEGRYWMYNSIDTFISGANGVPGFFFWSKKQVRNIMNKLEKSGYVLVGHFSTGKKCRTKWYTYK